MKEALRNATKPDQTFQNVQLCPVASSISKVTKRTHRWHVWPKCRARQRLRGSEQAIAKMCHVAQKVEADRELLGYRLETQERTHGDCNDQQRRRLRNVRPLLGSEPAGH